MFYKRTFFFYHLTCLYMSIENDDNTRISIASSGLIDRSSRRTSSTICRIFLEPRSFAPTWVVSLNFICYAWNIEQVIKSMWTIIKFVGIECPFCFSNKIFIKYAVPLKWILQLILILYHFHTINLKMEYSMNFVNVVNRKCLKTLWGSFSKTCKGFFCIHRVQIINYGRIMFILSSGTINYFLTINYSQHF